MGQKIAFKCCQVVCKGERIDVYKDPLHDKGKKSKMGEMFLARDGTMPKSPPVTRQGMDFQRFAGNCYDLTTVCHYQNGTIRSVWASDAKGKDGREDPAKIGRATALTEEQITKDKANNLLVPVFRNGFVLKEYTLADIRARAA